MATFRKDGRRWRVEMMRAGTRMSKTFDTKAECIAWAAEIARQRPGAAPPGTTFGDLLQRYAREVSESKRGRRWEQLRIEQTCCDEIAGVRLDRLDSTHFAGWRDRRRARVSDATVLREWTLLSAACNLAVREWKWLLQNPMTGVTRPPAPAARTRRIRDAEIERLYHACGYALDRPPTTAQARVGAALRLALATAMRAGELVGLRWPDIQGRVARIRGGKTGARDVPLTDDALAVLEQLRPVTHASGRVLDLDSAQLDALWRKARDRALVEDLHFHDSRAEALTRLARHVDVLTLARISGHKDLKMLSTVYYRETAAEIALRLATKTK